MLIWLPILGGVFTMMAGNARPQAARWIALGFAFATLLLCIPLFAGFDLGGDVMQYVEQRAGSRPTTSSTTSVRTASRWPWSG